MLNDPNVDVTDGTCTKPERQLVTKMANRVRQIQRYEPDAVFAVGYPPDAITAVQTMRQLDYVPPAMLVYGSGYLDATFIDGVRSGNDACGLPPAEPCGIISHAHWSAERNNRRRTDRRIAELFRQRYRRPMTSRSAVGFTGMLTLAQAINRAGSRDPERIRAALQALDVPSNETIMPWNGIDFDPSGQNAKADVVLQQIISGRYRVVYPSSAAVQRPLLPLKPCG